MAMKIETTIEQSNIKNMFKGLLENIDEILDEEIKAHLELIKTTALANKPWKDQTGTLRAGHVVRKTDDGWELVVDPFLNPQRGKKVTKDYGVLLEYGGWAWFYPTVAALELELGRNLLKRIKRELK